MAMTSGTATNYLDLYRKIRAFILSDGISGAGWLPVLGGAAFTDSEGIRSLISDQNDKWEVFDNSITSYVRFATTSYLTMQFFSSKTIGSIKITSPSQTGGGINTYSPKDVYFYTSANGIDWTLRKSWIGLANWTDKETKTLTLDAPVATQWVKLTFPVSYGSNADVAQIQLFNESGVRIHVNLSPTNATQLVSAQVLAKSPFTVYGVSAHIRVYLYSQPEDNHFNFGFSGAADMQQVDNAYTGLSAVNHLSPSFSQANNTMAAWDSSMPYWLYGNERYVYGFVKVGSTYRQFGFGYLMPFATPEQYPLPMFVGAEHQGGDIHWDDDDNNDIRGFTNPSRNSLNLFTPNNVWVRVGNYYQSNGDIFSPLVDRLWPGCTTQHRNLINAPGTDGANGNYAVYPLIAFNYNNTIYGELPSIYSVPNYALASEDTITIGGDTYRVFQNIWRTSRWDYCAVKEV